MRKALVLIALGLSAALAGANPAAINFGRMAGYAGMYREADAFVDGYRSLRRPNLASGTRPDAALRNAQALRAKLTKLKQPDYDAANLLLLVTRCLYNFDEASAEEVVSLYEEIDAKYPGRAEHHWIYGNFLGTTYYVAQGLAQLEAYRELSGAATSRHFREDYAYINLMVGKRLNAWDALTEGGTRDSDFAGTGIYDLLKTSIKESSASEQYETSQVFDISGQEDDGYLYVYSTMLGLSVPCKGAWKLQMQAFDEKRPAMVLMLPDDFSLDGHTITLSLMMYAYPESKLPFDLEERFERTMPITEKRSTRIKDNDFTVMTFEDPEAYQDIRNGMKGYIYFTTVQPTDKSGLLCEHAIDFAERRQTSEPGSTSYYRVDDTYRRLPEPIHFVIMIDSCTALDEETKALMEAFLAKAVFE